MNAAWLVHVDVHSVSIYLLKNYATDQKTDAVASMHSHISQPSFRGHEIASIRKKWDDLWSTRIILHHARIRKPLSVDIFATSFSPRRTNQLPCVVLAVDPSRPLSSLHKQEPAPMRFSRSSCVVSQSFEVLMAAQYSKDRRNFWGDGAKYWLD